MLNIAAIEIHAAGRHHLVRTLNSLVESAGSSPHLIPPLTIRPVAPEEAAFVHAPEIIVAGPSLCEASPDSLRRFRSLFPDAYLIGMLNQNPEQLHHVEELASKGVDELMSMTISGVQFMQRLIVLNRSLTKSRRGKLILIDGAKGGVGATSVTAGLAATLASHGHSSVVVDLDNDTQDLSRFLGARPYLNDALQLILNQQSPLTAETIGEALIPFGEEANPFWVVPPAMHSYTTLSPQTPAGKSFLAFLQMIDTQHRYSIVDLAHAGPELRSSLLRGADKIIVVVNGAPSTLHAAIQKVLAIKSICGDFSRILLCENGSPHSLPSSLLRSELCKLTGIGADHWLQTSLPYSRQVAYWPGSLSTPASIGCKRTKKALIQVASTLSESPGAAPLNATTTLQAITGILSMTRRALTNSHSTPSIPAIPYQPSAELSSNPATAPSAQSSTNPSFFKPTL